ncbi:MAG: 50S ribosomal protein P1 [Aigarchaeota archaeon]|nr:50S ribosomal protein P1 [Aigarchaeota archaeon]MDW8092682.1 50S ribosomal protein P1 [Nitrososphaerota archaeon]
MEYVYAALLLHKLGKPISEEGVRKIIEAAGGTVDEVRVKALVTSLQGINIDEALKSATQVQVAAVPSAPAQPQAAPAKEEKPKEEKKEEEALAGLSALFG